MINRYDTQLPNANLGLDDAILAEHQTVDHDRERLTHTRLGQLGSGRHGASGPVVSERPDPPVGRLKTRVVRAGIAAVVLMGASSVDTPSAMNDPSVSASAASVASRAVAASSPSDPASGQAWEPCETVVTDGGLPPDPSGVSPIEDITALTVVRKIPVPADPVALAFGAGSIWVFSIENGTVSRIDPNVGRVTDSVELGDGVGYGFIAADETGVWVTRMGDGSLSRLDPETLDATTIRLGSSPDRPYTVALGAGSVWVADPNGHTVSRIDPGTMEILEVIDVRPTGASGLDFAPAGVAVDGETVWVSEHRADALTRIDSATNEVTGTVCLGSPSPGRIVVGEGAVWVADTGGVVNRVSPASMDVEARIGFLYGPLVGSLAIGDGSVWVGNASHVVRIDPTTNEVDAAFVLSEDAPDDEGPAGGLAIAYGADSVWITHPTENAVLQVGSR